MAAPVQAITRYELSMPMRQIDLEMNRRGYIGPQVLRPRIVGIQAADVGKIPLNQLLSSQDTTRASGGGYKRSDFQFDKYSYSTTEHGWESPLDDRQIAIYAGLLPAELIHTQRTMNFVLEDFERAVAAAVMNTGTFTGAQTGAAATLWSTWATATPIQDVFAGMEAVRLNSGLAPNVCVMTQKAFFNGRNTAQIVDRIKYTETATQAEVAAQFAACLGIKRVVVAGNDNGLGLKNTANQQQTASLSRIWPDNQVFIGRAAETDDPQEPCFGRTFIWNGAGGEAPGALGTDEELALIVEEYREERVRGSVIRARTDWDLQLMYTQAGYLMTGVL